MKPDQISKPYKMGISVKLVNAIFCDFFSSNSLIFEISNVDFVFLLLHMFSQKHFVYGCPDNAFRSVTPSRMKHRPCAHAAPLLGSLSMTV